MSLEETLQQYFSLGTKPVTFVAGQDETHVPAKEPEFFQRLKFDFDRVGEEEAPQVTKARIVLDELFYGRDNELRMDLFRHAMEVAVAKTFPYQAVPPYQSWRAKQEWNFDKRNTTIAITCPDRERAASVSTEQLTGWAEEAVAEANKEYAAIIEKTKHAITRDARRTENELAKHFKEVTVQIDESQSNSQGYSQVSTGNIYHRNVRYTFETMHDSKVRGELVDGLHAAYPGYDISVDTDSAEGKTIYAVQYPERGIPSGMPGTESSGFSAYNVSNNLYEYSLYNCHVLYAIRAAVNDALKRKAAEADVTGVGDAEGLADVQFYSRIDKKRTQEALPVTAVIHGLGGRVDADAMRQRLPEGYQITLDEKGDMTISHEHGLDVNDMVDVLINRNIVKVEQGVVIER